MRVLRELERYYRAAAEDVEPYLRLVPHDDAAAARDGQSEAAATGETGETREARETLLVRQDDEGVDLALVLSSRVAGSPWRTLTLDERCQVIEGASHFLVVCERARNDRSTTHLELELQGEVDKWLVLSRGGRLDIEADVALRENLYDEGVFLHPEGSMEGDRYRLANNLAARFVHRLSSTYARRGLFREMQTELVRFFHGSQEEKLRAIAV